MEITVYGPKDRRIAANGGILVNTTSHSNADWSSGLSPFKIGPVPLYDGRQARVMENGWR